MQLITTTGSERAAHAVIRLNSLDDVLIARQALPEGLLLDEGITVRQPIPAGHKVAARDIAAGQPLRRYGQIIGFASQAITAGEHVHVHNLAMGDFARDYAFGVDARGVQAPNDDTFRGIVRADGRVATRNYVGIHTSVNCSATVARAVASTSDWPPERKAMPGTAAGTHSFSTLTVFCATSSADACFADFLPGTTMFGLSTVPSSFTRA